MTIFIVEDSAVVREQLSLMLNEIPRIEVIGSADTADDALTAIRQFRPNAIILDIQLRQGNGITVLEQIKRESPATLTVILTNYPYPQYRQRCLAAGADFFFAKTTNFNKVVEIFDKVVEIFEQISDNHSKVL